MPVAWLEPLRRRRLCPSGAARLRLPMQVVSSRGSGPAWRRCAQHELPTVVATSAQRSTLLRGCVGCATGGVMVL